MAQRFGFRFIETSAKLRINVDETFAEIVREIRRHNKVLPDNLSLPSGNAHATIYRNKSVGIILLCPRATIPWTEAKSMHTRAGVARAASSPE
jgi:hypothetical protein